MSTRLSIQLENDSRLFYPGQTIRGQVTLINKSEVKVKGLVVTIFGEGEVYWTESEALHDTVSPNRGHTPNQTVVRRRHVHREYKNNETYICEEILLFGQSSEEGGRDMILPPGNQTYPFAFELPAVGLPSSFLGSPFGYVRYTVEARMKRPLFRYDKTEVEFYVNGLLDLNILPNAFQPFLVNDRIDFGWLCCQEGYVTIDLSLDKTGFLPGDKVELKALILNFSGNTIRNVKVEFIQITEFITFDRRKKQTKSLKEIFYTHEVPGGGIERCNESFVLPTNLSPTCLAGCRIILMHYSILMTAEAGNQRQKLMVNAPIIIGTEPCPPPQLPIAASNTSSNNSRTVQNIPKSHSKVNTTLLKSECESGNAEGKKENDSAKQYYDPALNPFTEVATTVDDLIGLDSYNGASTTTNNDLL